VAGAIDEGTEAMKRSFQQWCAEYESYHQDPVNERIHYVCIPLIMFSIFGLLWIVPFPFTEQVNSRIVNWAVLAMLFCLLYYMRLSIALAAGMAPLLLLMLALLRQWSSWAPSSIWWACLAIFVAAWIAQFVGHRLEKKSPAFLRDVQYLLIGPAWLLARVYRTCGIRI
jgi:uncharacterized membrane protein YGL010W